MLKIAHYILFIHVLGGQIKFDHQYLLSLSMNTVNVFLSCFMFIETCMHKQPEKNNAYLDRDEEKKHNGQKHITDGGTYIMILDYAI